MRTVRPVWRAGLGRSSSLSGLCGAVRFLLSRIRRMGCLGRAGFLGPSSRLLKRTRSVPLEPNEVGAPVSARSSLPPRRPTQVCPSRRLYGPRNATEQR